MDNPEQTTNSYLLPSGTVSFLFTDIEGSTKLAQDYPAALPYLLARHAEILSSSIHQHNGVVFQIIGDAFCAAFHTASDALNAAVDAQHKLHQEAWDPSPIRVRMGIHTGTAHLSKLDDVSGGYAGYLTLARAQRVMSAAYGGQVLLSNSVAELVGDNPFAEVILRDLGEHHLKGLVNPERLWQAQIAGLPQDFPPIQSLHFIPGNLPVQLTSFIGRVSELAELKERMVATRLLTLTGVGGTGKTRLALQLAGELLEHYKNGAWIVELAPLSDPALIPAVVASSLGVREDPERPILETLLDYLRPKQLLLILDNCEHLIEASARFADQALHACPGISILATSREALGIAGEHIHPVPSLELPNPDKPASGDEIAGTESVRLFVDRVTDIQPRFTLTGENVAAVAQLCRRLDGIPLAIELAAARVKSMPVQMVADHVDDRFRLLTGGSRTALPRQQTLRAAIDWSYNLLNEPERRGLRCLSLFVGGCTLEAAGAIYNDGFDSIEVLQLLSSLVDKSLLILDDQWTDTRYALLETIRQYAREKVLESGESESLRSRFLDFYLVLAERAEPELFRAQQKSWLDLLEVEYNNLRNALEWSLEDARESSTDAGLRIIIALEQLWMVRGHSSEVRNWLVRLMEQPSARLGSPIYARAQRLAGRLASIQGESNHLEDLYNQILVTGQMLQDKRVLAEALSGLGGLAHMRLDIHHARELFRQSLSLFREIGNQPGIAQLLSRLGQLEQWTGDLATARSYLHENLLVCQELGHHLGIAGTLILMGEIDLMEGKSGQAQSHFEESLAIYRVSDDKPGSAQALSHLGDVIRLNGDLGEALALYEEGLSLFRDLEDKNAIGGSLRDLGFVSSLRGDIAHARSLFEDSLAIFKQMPDGDEGIALNLIGLASIEKNPERAVHLLGAAEPHIRKSLTWPVYRADFERSLNAAKERLDKNEFNTAWAEGQTMDLDTAITIALQGERV